MILVRDRMTSPAITVRAEAPLTEVVHLLERGTISAAPVVTEERLVGIVSTTDLLAHPPREGEAPRTAAQVMTSPVLVARPGEPLDEAAWKMVAGRVHRLVVSEDDRVLGILSARDILREVKSRRATAPIGSVMTTPVEAIAIGDTVDEASARLASSNVHGLVVVDGLAPVGVFTHAEALAARRLPPSLRSGPVEEVMSYETICLDVATPIYRAAAHVVSMNVRRILVVEAKHLVGILSCVDLVGVLARAPTDDSEGGGLDTSAVPA